jgi:hypothetical protein
MGQKEIGLHRYIKLRDDACKVSIGMVKNDGKYKEYLKAIKKHGDWHIIAVRTK